MTQLILTTPPAFSEYLSSSSTASTSFKADLQGLTGRSAFITADPKGRRLGSGGGTVRALYVAWKASGVERLTDWLVEEKHLVLHAGGESRRLPAYAAVGKVSIPVPLSLGLQPSSIGASLADYQVPAFKECLERAGTKAVVLVASGDVWLDFDPAEVSATSCDITGLGMRVSPAVAQHFGVYFVNRATGAQAQQPIELFRQKPSAAEINAFGRKFDALVDTGIWMLSVEAVMFLFSLCGWDAGTNSFKTADREPEMLDLYTEIGNALGAATQPSKRLADNGFSKLSSSVLGIENAHFHHLGSNRQLLESCEDIAHSKGHRLSQFFTATRPEKILARDRAAVWVSNCQFDEPVRLAGENLLTGLTSGCRLRQLETGQCVDVIPLVGGKFLLRPYHIDDSNRGIPGAGGIICGHDARFWGRARGLSLTETDVFGLKLYPVLEESEITQGWIDWFFAEHPAHEYTESYASKTKHAASEVADIVDFEAFFTQLRDGFRSEIRCGFDKLLTENDAGILGTDCARAANLIGSGPLANWVLKTQPRLSENITSIERAARFQMLLAELAPKRKADLRASGFSLLQTGLVGTNAESNRACAPERALKDDQIVWARSPVRLDLSGGWTDTPPYCLEHGGSVLNMAVLLNGQPPIQAFVRQIPEPILRIRSIDQGVTEEIADFKTLGDFRNPKGNFSLPKAAFALSGFLPEFKRGNKDRSLRTQLTSLGGGLEISMLSAVPKGSGLGTSSILAATLLAALNRACGLHWDDIDLYNRVLSVEQLLTTGGGWQDQAGALFPSIKLVETAPGIEQKPVVKYLPTQLFSGEIVNHRLLLYYTGITRMAKGILQEIVQSMFLGRSNTLRTLSSIRANTNALYRAIQSGDAAAFDQCIATSWALNKELDAGTSTPDVEKIITVCGSDLSACKLLGAGGGGYMLLCAKDAEAGARIRERLEINPPNNRARFINFTLSSHGVEVSVS